MSNEQHKGEHTIQNPPDDADALSKRGTALLNLQRFREALESYDQALLLQPDHAPTIFNHGTALANLQRFDEALASYEYALTIQPDHVQTLSNRGSVLVHFKRFEEALANYAYALELQPDYAEAHWNEGLCRLIMGDFALGWQKYEWRWKQKQSIQSISLRHFSQPLWLGKESLRNKTILLHAEQGLGDTIHFCRYAPLIAALGATVILEVQPSLKTLLRNMKGITHIIGQGEALPAFDFHCPLLSLPLACHTDLRSIPFGTNSGTNTNIHHNLALNQSFNVNAQSSSFIARTLLRVKRWFFQPTSTSSDVTGMNGSYVSAAPLHKAIWQNKLGTKTLPRVGLVWSGSTTHRNDHHRSIPLMDFMGIINPHNKLQNQTQFYCLQKELRANDQALLNAHTDIAFVGNELKDFSDTAALISLMDLVITVDTSVAHLAGAMGKPVWILLPFNADWRWLSDRNDSPWYPSARLFRQTTIGDWDSVMMNVQQELLVFNATNHADGNTKMAQSH